MIKSNRKKGFALLYAVLLTSAVLVVGVSLINIITQQLVLTSLNKNSQIAYYNARSVVNCLNFFEEKDYFVNYGVGGQVESIKNSTSVLCRAISESEVSLTSTNDSGSPIFYFSESFDLDPSRGGSVILRFAFNLDNLQDLSYSGCDEIQEGQTFESSCTKVVTVNGSNMSLSSINPRKAERTSLSIR